MSKTKTLKDAYREFRTWDRLHQHWERKKHEWARDLELIATGQRIALEEQNREETERQVTALVERLFGDAAFNRTLLRYNGWRPRDWAWACGPDGRLRKLLQIPGWPILQETIRRIRIAKGLLPVPRQPAPERPRHDATLEIKIQLGY